MTVYRVERLRELDQQATQGEWEFSNTTDRRGRKGEFRAPDPFNGFMFVGPWTNSVDAALIVEVRNALPAFLDIVDELACLVGMLEDDGCLESREDLDDAKAALARFETEPQ